LSTSIGLPSPRSLDEAFSRYRREILLEILPHICTEPLQMLPNVTQQTLQAPNAKEFPYQSSPLTHAPRDELASYRSRIVKVLRYQGA
jgi:hypothetical protein